MPGGRLTAADRDLIAQGLGDGHDFATIARGLGRPTSTVSREVARNGGRDGYRVEGAVAATAQRARRHPRRPGSSTDAAGDNPSRDVDAVRAFETEFAALMDRTGFPRIAGQVLVCLFTTDTGQLTAAQLIQRLEVSPASVSKAVRYLETLEFVRRAPIPGRRGVLYTLDEDLWYRAWTKRSEVFGLWSDTAAKGAAVLGVTTPAGDRLDEMSQFFALVRGDVAMVTEHWQQFFAQRRSERAHHADPP